MEQSRRFNAVHQLHAGRSAIGVRAANKAGEGAELSAQKNILTAPKKHCSSDLIKQHAVN